MAVTVTEIDAKNQGGNAESLAWTVGATVIPVSGDIVVVAARIDGNVGSRSCADSRGGNTYAEAATALFSASSYRIVLFYCQLTNSLQQGDTITLSWVGATSSGGHVARLTSAAASAFDKTASSANQNTSTPGTGTTATLSQADEVAFALFGWRTAAVYTDPSTWSHTNLTGAIANGTDVSSAVSYKQVAATTALSPTCTIDSPPTAHDAGGLISTFKVSTTAAYIPRMGFINHNNPGIA